MSESTVAHCTFATTRGSIAESSVLLREWDRAHAQWMSLMAAHEDCKERLEKIEALVQRRSEQLPPGDAELRICRAVRGLCIGAQRVPARRWSLLA